MARVPDSTAIPFPSPGRDPGERSGADVSGAFGAIEDLAQLAARRIGEVRARRQKAEDSSFATGVQAKARVQFSDIFTSQTNDAIEGAEDFTDTLGRSLDDATEDIIRTSREGGARPSQDAIDATRNNLTQLRASFLIQAGTFENNARVEMIGRRVDESVNDLAIAAFNDPSAIDVLLLEAGKALDQADEVLPADAVAELRLSSARDITESAVRGTIDLDPELALQQLNEGDFDEGLSAAGKASLVRAAQTAFASDLAESVRFAEKLEKDAEKAHKQQQTDTARELYGLAQDGALKRDELDTADIALSDYKALLKQIENPTTVDDLDVYVDLDARARDGADVRDEAVEALREGRITPNSFDKIIGRAEKAIDANSPSTPFDRGMDFISQAMKPNQLNPAVGAPQRYANAQADFNEFFDRNKDASVADTMAEARRIVNEFSILELEQITLTLRKPQFMAGGRVEPDLDETERRTLEAFEAGEIDAAEFGRQAVLIQRWRDARERFQRAQEQK